MPTQNISDLTKRLLEFQYNPAAIQKLLLNQLTNEVVDPTNPFVFSMEANAVTTAAFMTQNEINTRRLYPSLAQTYDDLYLHMSDKDYLDRFAIPSQANFTILTALNVLSRNLVYDPVTQGRKATIPKDTYFTIADTIFTLQYPIDIIEFPHGGIQITHDTTELSDLLPLSTNVIDFTVNTRDSVDYLVFKVPALQVKISSNSFAITPATITQKTLPLTDQYYYCRVFRKVNQTDWDEIKTTHTDQIYDSTVPTALLRVTDTTVSVTIPTVYISNGSVANGVRVDVYETKGPVNMHMSAFSASDFSAEWINLDKRKNTVYTETIKNIQLYPYSTDTVTGGQNSIGFEELRKRVIENTVGDRKIPVTTAQVHANLERQGFSVVKNIDLLPTRVFLATKELPMPTEAKPITPAAASVESFICTMAALVNTEGVYHNGDRVTLTPNILYLNNKGVINIVPKAEVESLINMGLDVLVQKVNNNKYIYTPFHYVLDATEDEFAVRPYYLDAPYVDGIRFLSQNQSTSLQVNTQTHELVKKDDGYYLYVTVKSNDKYKEIDDANVFAQLAYVPDGEVSRAYLNGTLFGLTEGKERIFQFYLGSNFDIDNGNYIYLNTFSILTPESTRTKAKLKNTFEIFYGTDTELPASWTAYPGDALLGTYLLQNNPAVISMSHITLNFGIELKALWAQSRSMVTAGAYKRYEADVPWVYNEDVYKTYPETGGTFKVELDGTITREKIHSAGDPMLDSGNNPIYRYRVGDVVRDALGKPIPLEANRVSRIIDLMFIEGVYYFATDYYSKTYREQLIKTIVGWVTQDIMRIYPELLDETKVYFYPKTSMGNIDAIIEDGKQTTIEAAQSFVVKIYVNSIVFDNEDLRQAMTTTTITTLHELLGRDNVSVSHSTNVLSNLYGSDAIAVAIEGLGGATPLDSLLIKHSRDKCSLKKVLRRQPDDSLIVVEDVVVEFIRHTQSI